MHRRTTTASSQMQTASRDAEAAGGGWWLVADGRRQATGDRPLTWRTKDEKFLWRKYLGMTLDEKSCSRLTRKPSPFSFQHTMSSVDVSLTIYTAIVRAVSGRSWGHKSDALCRSYIECLEQERRDGRLLRAGFLVRLFLLLGLHPAKVTEGTRNKQSTPPEVAKEQRKGIRPRSLRSQPRKQDSDVPSYCEVKAPNSGPLQLPIPGRVLEQI